MFTVYNVKLPNCCSPTESKLVTLSLTLLEVVLARPLKQVAAAAKSVCDEVILCKTCCNVLMLPSETKKIVAIDVVISGQNVHPWYLSTLCNLYVK
jgi:hypothetical protein